MTTATADSTASNQPGTGGATAGLPGEVQGRIAAFFERQFAERMRTHPADRAAESPRPLPDWAIIGAAKSATTSLCATLQAMPGVAPVAIKESDFFASERMHALGQAWYASLWEGGAARGESCGEASTAYTRRPMHEGAAERLAASNPDCRVVYLVREPVRRAYSQVVHRWTKQIFPERPMPADLRPYLEADPISWQSSMYAHQVEPWIAALGTGHVRFVAYESLVNDPGGTLARVAEFFGIAGEAPGELLKENDTARYQQSKKAAGVADRIKSLPVVGSLARLMPKGVRDAGWAALRGTMSKAPAASPGGGGMTAEVRTFIEDRISGDLRTFRERHGDPGVWLGAVPFEAWGDVAGRSD